jgi:hypothetical protein
VTCQKPAAYGRGAGYVSSDACAKNNAQGCEQYGALYYPKCAENFHAVGCCVCSPDCPNGKIFITSLKVKIQKKFYFYFSHCIVMWIEGSKNPKFGSGNLGL